MKMIDQKCKQVCDKDAILDVKEDHEEDLLEIVERQLAREADGKRRVKFQGVQ